jgi:CHAD domain-containing protein
MKKKEELKYIDKEWKDMKASLEQYLINERPEDLHHFRVQVKKIRAFVILSDSAKHHPQLAKHFLAVRKIFKQAGEIRNAYINLELGKAYQINNEDFLNSQQMLFEEANKKFKLKGDKYLKQLKESHQRLNRKIRSISDWHINQYYLHQLHTIAGSLIIPEFDDQLHESRKQIKILVHNHKIVHTALHTGINGDYLNEVQTAIGDWHDSVLAAELLSSDEEKGNITVNKLKKQLVKLKNKVTDIINDFYNRATTVVDLPVEQLS